MGVWGRARQVLLAALAAAAASACATQTPVPAADAAAADAAPAALDARPLPLWTWCPLRSAAHSGNAECAALPVPLAPGASGEIPLFVKHLKAKGTPRAQVWLLAGGPGGAGEDLEGLAETMGFLDPGLDLFLPDHRGTGRSARLACPTQERGDSPGGGVITSAEWPSCIRFLLATWGTSLGAFTATAAADDLGWLIERLRVPGRPVYLYGVSYGTYWVLRYLARYPGRVAGAVLDSVCPPGGCFVVDFDAHFSTAITDFLAVCAGDPRCASRLGADPAARASTIFASLDQGSCPAATALGLDRKRLRNILGLLLMSWDLRAYIPAVLLRVERCSAQDVQALAVLLDVFAPPGPGTPTQVLRSQVLQTHILLSELFAPVAPPAARVLQQIAESALASLDSAPPLAALHPSWPRYRVTLPHDPWPLTQVPILMLAGSLDPQTPPELAQQAADRLHAAHQQLVVLPWAPHATVMSSPTTDSDITCGLTLTLDFLQDPLAPLDLSCLQHLQPIPFDGDTALSLGLFGTASMWAPDPPDLQAARRERSRGAATWRELQRNVEAAHAALQYPVAARDDVR